MYATSITFKELLIIIYVQTVTLLKIMQQYEIVLFTVMKTPKGSPSGMLETITKIMAYLPLI